MMKRRFICLILLALAFAVICSGCGSGGSMLLNSRKVSDQEISDYLNEVYFLGHGLTLSEIKDVTEYPEETANKMLLTCTTIAANDDVEQIANWELNFELFNGTWIGTDEEMGLHETTLVRDLTEQDFAAAVCPSYHNYNYISVQSIETDRETKTATAYCTVYTNGRGYYIAQDVQLLLTYGDQGGVMQWVYREAPLVQECIGDYRIVITPEVVDHYEIEIPGSIYATFDIEQDINDPNLLLIKNFNAQVYYHGWYSNSWEELVAEDTPFSFFCPDDFHGWWSGLGKSLTAKVELSNTISSSDLETMQMTFQISGGSLYVSKGYSDNSVLKSNLSDALSFDQSYWTGTINN